MSRRSERSAIADIDARRRQIIDQIAALGPVMPGSLVNRSSRCGNSRCRCREDPSQLHGPYPTWTRSIDGKTVTRSLSVEQADRYRPWFDNARRLRDLIDELKQLGIEQAQSEDQWPAS